MTELPRKKGAASPRQRPLDHASCVVEVSPSTGFEPGWVEAYSQVQYVTCKVTCKRSVAGRVESSQDTRSRSINTVLPLPRW